MLGRLFSFLGFLPGLSGASGLASGFNAGAQDEMDTGGEAAVLFEPGRRLASADPEETDDERRTRLTDRDLVWPGKTETIHIGNPEARAYRFDLTLTDLDPAFYVRRPPTGGQPQREGGILLQPGEQASFEVAFLPPPAGEKARTRTFSFVLTCFDPRRSGDSGEIVQDLPLRWVALPGASDLQITPSVPLVVTRPWRREARFAVRFQNRSYLPPTVGLTILRATSKDGLERGGETIGTIQQALEPRTSGVWQCRLPPLPRRGSYYATVRGGAQVASGAGTPLALPRPVAVRYVPWLRLGRDWLFLLGVLLLLFWLAWGVPVRRTPVVRVSLAFAGLDRGQIPADSRLQDLNVQMILQDERGHDLEGQPPLPGVVIGDAYEFIAPTHWYGFRWQFGDRIGWNGWSRAPQRFRITVAPAEAEKSAFRRFDLNTPEPDGVPAYSVATSSRPFGAWVTPATFAVPAAHGVFVSLRLGDLGALAGKDVRRFSVAYTLDGQDQPPRTFQLLHDAAGGLRPLTLDLSDHVPLGASAEFTVRVTGAGLSSYDVQPFEVKRQDKPFTITLAFPKAYPRPASRPPVSSPDAPASSPGPAGTPPPPVAPPRPGTGGIAGGAGKSAAVPVKHVALLPVGRGDVRPGVGSGPAHGLSGNRPAHAGPGSNPPPTPPVSPNTPPPVASPTAPAAPGGLTAVPNGPTQISLHWEAVPGADRYVLYRSGGGGGSAAEKHLAGDTTAFSDTDLTPGTVYFYRVQSKNGSGTSPFSARTAVMTRPLATIPATVTLGLAQLGKDLHATLDFVNISHQTVYLDKVSACMGGKIGDDVFRVTADGQPVPFSGQKSKRRTNPGPRQFSVLLPGESARVDVVLNRSYRCPSGTHAYAVTYSGLHDYPGRLQSLTLQSDEARCTATR